MPDKWAVNSFLKNILSVPSVFLVTNERLHHRTVKIDYGKFHRPHLIGPPYLVRIFRVFVVSLFDVKGKTTIATKITNLNLGYFYTTND